MNHANITSFWANLDGCIVINLDERNDRWEKVENTLNEFIPSDKFDRLSAVNGKSIKGYGKKPWFRGRKKDFRWAGRAGCTLSHRRALEEGLRRGWEVFLILEDDVCLRQVPHNYLEKFGALIFNEITDWDMCYLGFTTPRGPASKIAQITEEVSLCKIRGARTTHAYLVKAPLARWLLTKLPTEENVWAWCAGKRIIDRWYSRHISGRFSIICTSPSFVIQARSHSDLLGREADDWDLSDLVTKVPDEMCSQRLFCFRWWLAGIRSKLEQCYDGLRGYVKYMRGF